MRRYLERLPREGEQHGGGEVLEVLQAAADERARVGERSEQSLALPAAAAGAHGSCRLTEVLLRLGELK